MREQPAKLRACLEQLGFRAARGDAQLLGDLLVGVALDVVQHEDGASAGGEPLDRLVDALREEAAVHVVFHRDGVVLHHRLELGEPPHRAQRIERAIHRDAVRPGGELRIAPPRGQRAEDLDPDFLTDVFGQVGVTGQTPDDGIDVRRVLRPKGTQRPFVTFDCLLNGQKVRRHGYSFSWSRTAVRWLPNPDITSVGEDRPLGCYVSWAEVVWLQGDGFIYPSPHPTSFFLTGA